MVDVSVVIATYNRAAQVKEAIDSVLAQTTPVREVIVVDDGSRDNTREQLLAYGDKIRPFFQKNGGASAARNSAMREAKGEWIAFLDDDDVWVPSKIERQMDVAKLNPALGLIYCSDYAVDEQLRILYTRNAAISNRGDIFDRLLIKNFIFTSCVIARRSAVEKAGYMDLKFKFAQDWDLWLKIAAEHPVDFAPEPLVLYRQSSAGCLTKDMKAEDRLREMKEICEQGLKLRKAPKSVERRARFEIESQWASTALVQGQNGHAFPHAVRSVLLQPKSMEGYRLTAHSLVPSGLRARTKQILKKLTESSAGNSARGAPYKTSKNKGRTSSMSPVVIMNMFYSGLAIARDLAGTGIRVIGLSADKAAYGNFTRFCDVRFAPDSQAQPEMLAEYLKKSAEELRGAVIFPTRDADVVFLDRYREELREYRISIPPRDCLSRVLDKGALVEAARSSGVAVPRTIVAHNPQELESVPEQVGFPCVVKPVSSYLWRGEGKWETVGCRKAFRSDSWEDLRAEYERVAQVNPDVLVQEWIPGSAREIVILGGYFGEGSELLGHFCARKLVQEPDDFGTGCVVQNFSLQELIEPSMRLCKGLGYRGMAEIEYKKDANTGEYKLIEINTRHWDWHQLGQMSGVNLTRVAYSDLTDYKLDAHTPSQLGGKWVAEDSLLLHSASGIYKKRLTLRAVLRQISGPRVYGIFRWADPMPFLHYTVASMFPMMGKMAWRKLRTKG